MPRPLSEAAKPAAQRDFDVEAEVIAAVSNRRLALQRREKCPSCHATGGIRVEQTIKGHSILLQWFCSKCEASWPVVRSDQHAIRERRTGPADRRQKTRSERRSR